MSSQPSQIDALDILKATMAALKASRRNVLAPPELVESLREAIEAEGLAQVITVTPSNFMKPGEIYIYSPTRLPL